MKEIVRHVLLLGSAGVLWSVPPEIQFYLFFPLIWLLFSNPKSYQVIGVLVASFLALDSLAGFPSPGILLVSKLAFFLFGAAVGRLQPLLNQRLQGNTTGILALALPLFILVSNQLFPNADNAWGLAAAFAAALAVLLVAQEQRLSAAFFAAAPMRFLGKISFSLYLFHVPVMFLMGNALSAMLPAAAVVPTALVAAILIAWVSYEYIETPARRELVSLWHQRRSTVLANPQPNT